MVSRKSTWYRGNKFSTSFFSINVWCGMIDDMLIGPVILDDRMTGQNYLDFLQNELAKQLEDVPLSTRIATYFQHDGAPSHYTRHVMQHLNDTFPNRWIGRGSTINWPPRSPDLSPLDFYLWGLMKSEVYRKKADTRDELLVNILDGCYRLHKGRSRRTQTNNTPCLHTSCKVHWCWRWNFRTFIINCTNSVTWTINTGIRKSTYR